MRYLPAFVVGVLAVAGCVVVPQPYLRVVAPEIRGRVLDAATREPMPDVAISFEGHEGAAAHSGADGRFRLPRQRDLILTRVFTPCPVYEFPEPRRLPGALVVTKPGWPRRTVVLRPFYDRLQPAKNGGTIWHPNHWDDPVVDLGDVILAR